jgi:hypothetical protein
MKRVGWRYPPHLPAKPGETQADPCCVCGTTGGKRRKERHRRPKRASVAVVPSHGRAGWAFPSNDRACEGCYCNIQRRRKRWALAAKTLN